VITPTKALTPSHVKGLLWLDVLYRGTSLLHDTSCLWNLRPYNVTAQTLGYWEYLDRTLGHDQDYCSWSELELSKPYIEMHAKGAPRSFAALRPYLEAVERDGYVHPASRRMLDIWKIHLSRLNVYDHGLARNDQPGLSVGDVIDALDDRSLLVDHRPYGGPAYLDATAHGLPLRQAITPEGHANYLVCVLRQLLPQIDEHDRVVLVHDKEIESDYVLLDRVLRRFGATVSRLSLGRVPIDGTVQSSRFGGWEAYMVDALYNAAMQEFSPEEFALAMRLYFVAVLTRDSPQTFRPDVLRKQLTRARRLLTSAADDAHDDPRSFLRANLVDDCYVDPYRVTVSLFEKHRPVPVRALLDEILVPRRVPGSARA
jgi:hypothetical protein